MEGHRDEPTTCQELSQLLELAGCSVLYCTSCFGPFFGGQVKK